MNERLFRGKWWHNPWVLCLLIFLISFLPRLSAIGRYITPDELIWVYRSVQFRQALLQGQWVDTLTTGHPGVITMWLGMVGISLQLWLRPESQVIYQWITHLAYYNPENTAVFPQLAHFLNAARLPVIVINSLGIVGIYLLAVRSFGRLRAMLITLLLALDPFVVGLSSLLHVDALTTTFITLSLLAMTPWILPNGRINRSSFILAASMTALAVLSKSPALLLLPFTAFIFLIAAWHQRWSLRQLLTHGLLWLFTFLLVALLLFPALWAGPTAVITLISSNATRHIDTALRPTFFLGQMAFDHGPLFYPVVLLFRLGPLVCIGLVWALIHWLRQRGRPSFTTLLFALWPLLFLVAITFAAKKFDRYALPAIPALTILAALAWAKLWPQRQTILLLLFVLIQTGYLLWASPYPLTSYNPLVGGALTARYVLPQGWGEVVSAAGEWLATQPGAEQQTAVTSLPPALSPFFPGQTLTNDYAAQADYMIVTASTLQADPQALVEAQSWGQLRHTIHFNGLDQAWIWQQSNPQRPSPLADLPSPFTFDNRVQLLAAATDFTHEAVQIQLRWRLQQIGRYDLQFTLRDENGHVWNQLNTPLLNSTDFYPEHWASNETPQVRYTLSPPAAMPPGRYTIDLALFDAATSAQLPLLTADNTFRGVVYDLPAVNIPSPAKFALVSELDIGTINNQSWLDDRLILWGHKPLPDSLLSGSRTVLDVYWQAVAPLPAAVQIQLQVGDTVTILPLSRYPSADWRVGEPVHEKYDLVIPPDLPAGLVSVTLKPASGTDTAVSLGQIEIIATDRQFQLPDNLDTTLNLQFGSDMVLRGMKGPTVQGDTLSITLYWQTEQPPASLYTAFVHVLDADGRTIVQADQWPGGLPSNTWAPSEVIADNYTISLPADAAPGQLAIGLYTADNGLRLPLTDPAGNTYPDDRLLIPFSP